jgi:steroid delta-isomerase-like uncharacterized protein
MLLPDTVLHDGGMDTTGPGGFYAFYDRIRATFSELHITVVDSIADSDKVCVRWSCTAKHSGDGLGVPPTGKSVHFTGITIMQVSDGKIVEAWQNWDMLGMMEQLQGVARAATYIT